MSDKPSIPKSTFWSREDLRDLYRFPVSSQLSGAYRLRSLRSITWRLVSRLERGPFYSFTLREILRRYHGVHVGAYSYGPCLTPNAIPSGVVFGRYCSIGSGLRIFLRNHPYDRLSMHPFFYNPACGLLTEDNLNVGTLKIGDDTWIGEQVIITPGCQRIGIGAVVGAGSVVTRNVPDFAIVAGNPAKLIRMRFSDDVCQRIYQSQWWQQPVSKCQQVLEDMVRPLSQCGYVHPLLSEASTSKHPSASNSMEISCL